MRLQLRLQLPNLAAALRHGVHLAPVHDKNLMSALLGRGPHKQPLRPTARARLQRPGARPSAERQGGSRRRRAGSAALCGQRGAAIANSAVEEQIKGWRAQIQDWNSKSRT